MPEGVRLPLQVGPVGVPGGLTGRHPWAGAGRHPSLQPLVRLASQALCVSAGCGDGFRFHSAVPPAPPSRTRLCSGEQGGGMAMCHGGNTGLGSGGTAAWPGVRTPGPRPTMPCGRDPPPQGTGRCWKGAAGREGLIPGEVSPGRKLKRQKPTMSRAPDTVALLLPRRFGSGKDKRKRTER